jgi:hypothetical protein
MAIKGNTVPDTEMFVRATDYDALRADFLNAVQGRDIATSERDAARAEVARLTAERDQLSVAWDNERTANKLALASNLSLTVKCDALRAALVVPHEVIEDMSMPHACSCRICGRQMRGPMVMDDQRRGRDITLECAVSRLLLAIEKLSENPPGKKPGTYFEASPSKDPESYKRWIELNDAGAFIRKTLAARKSSERVET